MKLAPFLILIVLTSVRGLAQENFQIGYVVTSNGDTLRGKIDYPEWIDNPRQIDFLDGRTGQKTRYMARGLAAFGVNDEVYRSYSVTFYPYSQDPAVVTASSWSDQPYDTAVFLRLVTGGRLNLYGFRDQTDVVYYFIQAKGQTPVQLRIQNKVVRHDAVSNVTTVNLYKSQLSGYVTACSAIAQKEVPVAYEENALKKLIDTYNHCGVHSVDKSGRLLKVNLLVLGGGVRSSVKPAGNTNAASAHWPAFYGPTGGLGVWIQPARGSRAWRRWGIVIDGLFDAFDLKSGRLQANYYQAYTGRMEYYEAKGNLQLRYAYPLGNFRPFLGAGFSNTLIFNNTSSQKLVDAGDNTTIHQPLFGSDGLFSTYRPGGFGVVGLAWKRWSIEGRYERTADLVNTTTGVKVPVTNIYTLVAFRF